jgi:hypothetical protein
MISPSTSPKRRPPTKRLHHGIAGSPLARIIPFPEPETPPPPAAPKKRGRGRPRKHADNATKQKTYRGRRDSGEIAAERMEAKYGTNGERLPAALTETVSSGDAGWFIKGAPHGVGRYVTGGYDSAQCDRTRAANDRSEHGGRAKPKGAGPYSDEEKEMWGADQKRHGTYEDEEKFTKKIHFPKTNKLDEYEKEQIFKGFIRDSVLAEPCKEFCEELENVGERYWADYSTFHCSLCGERLGVSWLPVETVDFVVEHFQDNHKRARWKAIRESAPSGPPKTAKGAKGRPVRKCLEDHAQAAKFLAELGELGVGGAPCKKCRRIIYSAADARSPYFRNTPPNDPKPNNVIELTSKMNSNPMGGEVHTSSSGSQPGADAAPKTDQSCEEDRPL